MILNLRVTIKKRIFLKIAASAPSWRPSASNQRPGTASLGSMIGNRILCRGRAVGKDDWRLQGEVWKSIGHDVRHQSHSSCRAKQQWYRWWKEDWSLLRRVLLPATLSPGSLPTLTTLYHTTKWFTSKSMHDRFNNNPSFSLMLLRILSLLILKLTYV